MDKEKLGKIKNAVRANFDVSSDTYSKFEERHGFFQRLNSALVGVMGLPEGCRILDVGCGTGASCEQLLDSVSGCSVVGLDNSTAMLEAARSRLSGQKRITLVHGDAAALVDHVAGPFDAVIYSASIFLIPDFRDSLRQVVQLLKPGGTAGMTFMDGIYDKNDENLLAQAEATARQGVSLRKAVVLDDLISFLREIFGDIQERTEDFELDRDVLKDFFSVPAMSAGLFPGFPYEERVERVGKLFECLPRRGILFRWAILIGRKT